MSQPLIPITSRQAVAFASFLVLYEFTTYMANDMIMPGMLQVVHTFHGEISQVATSLTMYMLGGLSLQLFLGPLSDRYGRRPIMLFGAFLFVFTTVLIGFSNNMLFFMVGRFLQGMGLCFINVVGYAALQEMFEDMDAIRYLALMANISILAPLIGPLVGALIISVASWRYIYLFTAVLAIIALMGLSITMPETIGAKKRNGEVIPSIPLAPRIILANYWHLLTHKKYLLVCVAGAIAGAPCIVWIALSPIILVDVGHLTVIEYALWQIPVFGACILGNMVLHYLTYKMNIQQLIYLGSIILIGALAFMFFGTLWDRNGYFGMMPGLILYFFGMSICCAPLYRLSLILTTVPKGTVSAVMSMVLLGLQAAAIEGGNLLYQSQQNIIFAGYCLSLGIIYGIVIIWLYNRHPNAE